jgi:cytochrome c-type biogenesis protein
MRLGRRALYIATVGSITALLLVTVLAVGMLGTTRSQVEAAPDFTVTDYLGDSFSLSDSRGNVTVLHITQLENPLCIECEEHMTGQISELARLVEMDAGNITVLSLNVRKNPYSEDGFTIANEYYGLNISWRWVEEFEPFVASSQYMDYWMLDGGFANPTIILIDQEQDIVAVRHVYCMGKGEVDGIQTAEMLLEDSSRILSGEWGDDFSGTVSDAGMSAGGMFLLGVVTAFSPCSIALMMAVISYIGSMRVDRTRRGGDGDGLGVSLTIGVWFTIGTSLVFMAIGLFLAYIGGLLELSSTFYLVTGALLVVVGVNAIYPLSPLIEGLKWRLRSRQGKGASCASMVGDGAPDEKKRVLNRLSAMPPAVSGLALGILFSVGWAPCAISLVFPVIVLALTQEYTLLTGALMLFVFGLGHGAVIIPFCAVTGEAKERVGRRFANTGMWVQVVFGLAVVAIGIIFALRFVGLKLW